MQLHNRGNSDYRCGSSRSSESTDGPTRDLEGVERTLNEGWTAGDAKPGTQGKVLVLTYQDQWEDRWYEEKEVSVDYKGVEGSLVLLTVKARYGKDFPRGEQS